MKRLGVLVDGAALPDEQAHALWDRFSHWMDEHRGDLAGFAAAEGFASVHPGVDGDRPVLRASRTVAQKPYVSVNAQEDHEDPGRPGGSLARQSGPSQPSRPNGRTSDSSKKRRR